MLWNERRNDDRISYSVISIPAGLSHRLKPARRAALAVEKEGRLFYRRQDIGRDNDVVLLPMAGQVTEA